MNNFTIEEVRKFWDGVAGIYERENDKVHDTHNQRFIEAVKYLNLKDGDKTLNIWSRTGSAIPFLRDKNKNIELYNLEVSPEMIKLAKERFPEEKFIITELHHLDFTDNYFNYVISLETLEHCPDPLIFLKELYRVLTPGGQMVLSTPPASCEPFYQIYNSLGLGHGEGPHKFLSSERAKEMLETAGFKLLDHKGTLLIPLGPAFLKIWGEKLIAKHQKSFLSELGIRQFYFCQK